MLGEIINVWSQSWKEIWVKLSKHEHAPEDLFCELYRELIPIFNIKMDVQAIAEIVDNKEQAKLAFRKTKANIFKGEYALVRFFEDAYVSLEGFGYESLTNYYFNLVKLFIDKYNLRYELCPPFHIHSTLPGIFSQLTSDLRDLTRKDAHLNTLMNDYDNAIRDLRIDDSECRIKTCIHKQMNLLEALGASFPGVSKSTLGEICDELKTWPHQTIKKAMQSIYGFTSDYPGIRHGGNPKGKLREIEMRDMIAISILLAGFSPYMTDQLNSDLVYRRR